MLMLLWNVSAAIRGYMRFYMPTNIAIDRLRTPRGIKWAIPVALVAAPAHFGAMAITADLALRPGFGWLNLLVILFFWNAMKFVWIAVFAPLWALGPSYRPREHHRVPGQDRAEARRTIVRLPTPA